MKVLVLGSNGQLGRCLYDQFSGTNYDVIYSCKDKIDLCDINSLKEKIIFIKPDIVINAAAFTAVDNAEEQTKKANLINHLAVSTIANICNELGAWLVHISTDYVFDGNAKNPYKEDEKTNPQCVYGQSKLKGELAIKSSGSKYIILRTAWVFSEYGNNFLKTMLRLGKDRKELNVVGDQLGCPTYAQDIAKAIVSMLSNIVLTKSNSEIFHFCGDDACTWHEFAKVIFLEAKALGYATPVHVNSIMTADYPTPALRPGYSVLECSKVKHVYGLEPSNWRSGIKTVLKKLKDHND